MTSSDLTLPLYRPRRPDPIATLREAAMFARRVLGRMRAQAPAEPISVGRGRPLLMIPTLLRDDRQTAAFRRHLTAHGYQAFGWELGPDLGPTPKLISGVERRLLDLSEAHGPVAVVGLSMGGLFARWLALRHPDRVSHAISICSPFRAPLDSFFLPLRPAAALWPVPSIEAMAAELEAPLPVPQTCIWSRHDGIVAAESCRDPRRPEDCFAIDGPHVLIAGDPEVWRIVLGRLAWA